MEPPRIARRRFLDIFSGSGVCKFGRTEYAKIVFSLTNHPERTHLTLPITFNYEEAIAGTIKSPAFTMVNGFRSSGYWD
jgi:hypothetical protein